MITLINPNSSVAMTASMLATAQDEARGVAVTALTSHQGPPSIQGPEDGAAAVPPMLELVRQVSDEGAEAIIIGCFDDTGLAEAQEIAACPVIGIGQAACFMATLGGGRFSVVTTLAVSVPILEANIRAYGLAGQCARVRASGVEVLALEQSPRQAQERIIAEVRNAEREDGISSVVLGCGGMVHLPGMIRQATKLRPIDGIRAAVSAACLYRAPDAAKAASG